MRWPVVNAGATTTTSRQITGAAVTEVIRGAHGVGETFHQVNASGLAERGVERAGLRIDGDQIRVVGAKQQPFLRAACPERSRGVGPVRDAAMDEAKVARTPGLPVRGIELPDRLARSRIDRRDLPERGHRVEHALHHQRRVVIHPGPRHRIGGDDGVVGRGPSPRDRELADVVSIDLIQWRVFLARGIAAVVRPFSRPVLGAGRFESCHRDKHRRVDLQ